MESNEYKQLIAEIEKLKFHNSTMLTLMGLVNEDKMQTLTIHENIVMFDLSKNDFRELTKLIQSYNGNNFALEQKALKINPIFKRKNLIGIIKSFVVSEMLLEKSLKILKSYE
ncbi:hypothetical protein H1Q58_08150 [Planococcus maritimus]|uniref:Uncharacterized protein n=1 Tax=Planococcus maritimus TaxID=192421 RepID=A0A7D7R2V0_PLAMR|nr:hypothetical protein [Planococcus maritimus]QMT18916.1 hypothetical protein H1Q58_08150 [Planococcus maritimus]